MTTTTATTRKRRPMIEMTGTVADLREGDYVDSVGDGVIYRKINVRAILHKIHTRYGIRRGSVVEVETLEFLALGEHRFRSDAVVHFRRFAD
jgi:hypothetical protein